MSPAVSFEASAIAPHSHHSVYTRPSKKPRMSITQTYFLAHSARGKLSKEASRPDHDLRLLVGHANMLDSLMIDLANAEQEQERWFNQSINGAIPAETEQEDDDDEEEQTPEDLALNNTDRDWDVEEIESTDDDSDEEPLVLTRTISRSQHQQSPSSSPPELTTESDSDSDSDDDMMPSSPPDETMPLSEKQRQAIATTSYYDAKDASLSDTDAKTLEQDGFFIPSRSRTTTVAAY